MVSRGQCPKPRPHYQPELAGASWNPSATPTSFDLYAVAFSDASHALAVGKGGDAVYTSDGGASWLDVALGQDMMLAAVIAQPDGSFLVGGENGVVFVYRP